MAEGIQTAGQVRKLRSLGCEYGQGYLFSKAVPGDESADLIAGAAVSETDR